MGLVCVTLWNWKDIHNISSTACSFLATTKGIKGTKEGTKELGLNTRPPRKMLQRDLLAYTGANPGMAQKGPVIS